MTEIMNAITTVGFPIVSCMQNIPTITTEMT